MRWRGVAIVLVCLGACPIGGSAGAGTIDAASGAPDRAKCLATTMRRTGASSEAVAFTKAIGGDGYMRELGKPGRSASPSSNFPSAA
jgi:hypothetical protein